MKKQLGLAIVVACFWLWTTFAATMPMQTASKIETNCTWWTFSKEFYLGKTTQQRFFDRFQWDAGKDYAFWFSSSFIEVYNPFWVLSFKNWGAFHFKSNLKPSEEFDVVVASQNFGAGTEIVSHAPNRTDIAAQLVFNVSRRLAIGKGNKDVTYTYMRSSDNTVHSVTKNLKFDSKVHTDKECLNIYVARCWDTILDTKYWEQCDPKDPNKTGWGNGGCDATCKPIINENPKCDTVYHGSEKYNPNYPKPRIEKNPALCNPGEVVNFIFDVNTGKYTWTCNGKAGTNPAFCQAKDLWCGDGKKNGPEQCDPKDPNKTGWGTAEKGCDATCKPVNKVIVPPACNAEYTTTQYNPTYPAPRLNGTMKLCKLGEVIKFQGPDAQGNYTWGCVNDGESTTDDACKAKDLWCGDGKKNGPEQCDPKDPNKTGWGNGGCDATCKPVNKVVIPPACNAEYTTTQYNPSYPAPRLNGTMKLCKPGEVIKFQGPDAQGNYTWGCVNDGVSTADDACKAKDLWCGDGKKNGPEQCDPKDPNKAGWGNGGCDASCKPITKPKPEPQCNSQYHGKVGYAPHYPPTPWLHTGMNLCNPGQIVDFQGPDAQGFFAWKCKGEVGTSVAECQARQERCGDGKKNGPEQCDPKDPNKAGWGKGGCDATCKPIHKEDPKVYDLALTKKLATKKTSYELGDLVDFEITVYNQGELSAKNIEITEYLPNGLLLEDTKWTQNGNTASFLIRETILPRQYKTIKLRMRIADNFTGTKILNTAEISKDNAADYGMTDKDSTPDTNPKNDCIVGEDNHYIDGNGKAGGACTPATDEDDHDIVPILIKKPDLPVVPPYIEKELQGDKNHKYQVGELVGFKMPFGNTGSQMIKKVKIRDILPLNLEYVSSEIYGVQPYTKGLYASGKLQILEYSGFNLAPGQQGYLLMTGRVLADYQDARVNRVGIYENDYLRDWDDESYQIAPKAVKIEKTVDKSQVFSGEVVEFTIKVSATEGKFTTLKVVDTLPKGLVFVPNTQLLTGQTTETKLVSFATGVNGSGLETLTWELSFPKGFKKSDFFLLKLKAKLLETSKTTYTNIACVFNPDDPQNPSCDPEDVKPRLEDVKLKIKKYVSDAVGGTWIDDSKQFSNGTTAFFKLVISGASAPLTGFRVTDRIEGNLSYLDSSDLANNAFTGLITFGANNPTKPAYTITPKVTTGVNFTDLEWKVSMGSGFFMPGDSLVVIFKTKKNGNQTNIGHVYYPRPNGGEGHDQDPASVTTPSGWGGGGWGWGGRSGGGGSSCGNGTQNGFEFCDRGSQNGSKIITKGERLFRDDASPVSDYEGEYRCTSSCTLERRGTNALPACFNTQNGSISIMKGEMLPFYWNIEGMLGKRSEQEKIDYLKKSFFLSSNGECREKDIGKIDLTTMECTFAVYGPGKSNSKVVSAFTTDCINVDGWSKGNGDFYPAIKSFVEQNKKGWLGGSMLNHYGGQRNVFDSLDNNWEYPTLMPLSSKLIISNFGTPSAKLIGKERTDLASKDIQTFGEYKLSLEQMKYKTCISAVDKEKKTIYKLSDFHPGYERVCEVDFAVTAPYLIQKSPYGIGNKATDALGKYRLKNGTSFVDEYFRTKDTDPKAYEAPKNMQKLFTTFKNKYQKLARAVKGKSDLSKVPGKSIYFYAGNEELTTVLGRKVIEKPFTLIASKGQDLKIKGNLLTNAMIMTAGKIIFDAEGSCNGDKSTYGHAGQMVKGIFYAGQGFGSINHEQLENTYENISKKERCNYGNLHIKGVAIGDLSKVVEARRSELYTWFNANSSKGTAKKKDIVVNGASVLVEYNPSLRGQLPPGAEEFNKALQIYRK